MVIYDFGENNGDDIAYYLSKRMRVVAVEANKVLCAEIERRYTAEIKKGDLVVLNCAVSDKDSNGDLPFYIHREGIVSQIDQPDPVDMKNFELVLVKQRRASDIIREFGDPHYIKIDVEHFDHVVLNDLFSEDIRPEYISAESHSIDVFCLMVAAGYSTFNMVDGSSVQERYGFPPHSAGPFGEDLSTPWFDRQSFFFHIAAIGLGWYDIHASRSLKPQIKGRTQVRISPSAHLSGFVPSLMRAIRRRVVNLKGSRHRPFLYNSEN
jgi:FkbM family methyltransferase